MSATKLKQILATNIHLTVHKRYQHNLNQIKGILQRSTFLHSEPRTFTTGCYMQP